MSLCWCDFINELLDDDFLESAIYEAGSRNHGICISYQRPLIELLLMSMLWHKRWGLRRDDALFTRLSGEVD